MNVYLDESGDLGWKFDAPFRDGGSSRYLTIGIVVAPKRLSQKPKRIVRRLYKKLKQSTSNELKAAELSPDNREWCAKKIAALSSQEPEINYISITVRKENVQQHLREDPNKLYNYMIRLALVGHIARYPLVNFIPDKRTVKVASGNSLADYLQIYLWYEMNVQTKINCIPQESKNNLNLQFADYLTNFIWRKYELNDSKPFNILRTELDRKELFF